MATIVTRAAKGSPLTHAEVDANFENLNNDKVETSAIGTAASLDVGTSAGNVVQLNGSGQLPAIDGSLLTGIVSIPSGVITMWSGSVASIPSGWVICDGLNGTPNLTGRFVIHADADAAGAYNVGDTGGSSSVTLTEANLPSHTHGVGTYAAASGGAHSHTASSGNSGNHTHTGNTSASGNHTHTGNTSNTGSHSHNFNANTGNSGNHSHNGYTSNNGAHTHGVPANTFSTVSNGAGWRDVGSTVRTNNTNSAGNHSHNVATYGAGDHSHNFNANTGSTGAHSHSFTTDGGGDHSHSFTTAAGGDHSHTITVDSGGAHTHTISGASAATGSGSAHENRPPYYALAYIMKT